MDNVTFDDYATWTVNDSDELCSFSPSPEEVLSHTYIHSIICAFGLIGNVLVMITYGFYKRTKTMTDVYLFNVAVADLLFVVALPLIAHNEQNGWPMGSAACKMLRSAYSINLYSGMLLLACISGDRYVAIVQARRSFGSRSRTVLYGRLICAAVWVSALFLTLPTLIYTELFEEHDPMLFEEHDLMEPNSTLTCELTFKSRKTAKLMKVMVPSLQMAVGFFLPLVVMVFCYSSIMCTLLKAHNSQRHKAIRVVWAVVVVFIICHFPYNVTLLIHTVSLFTERSCEEEKTKLKVLATSRSIAYLHCCLNPILYAFIGVKFRSRFRKILSDLWCFGKRYLYSARLSRGTSEVCISGLRTSEASNNASSFSA
ncbi:PREDICTED: C-C chemokine receptor type 6-like [Poecilia mexicana]|uniref:G-protein coupled receptors family 1 profile domain-containing protein n=1 Tax=Poecilia mexicana TaxID=48701 RepID=A0A3B3Z464_9TELE|nr:PREDICTED: C-C chemokine receptor type 6-like [Poecilia mexicana]